MCSVWLVLFFWKSTIRSAFFPTLPVTAGCRSAGKQIMNPDVIFGICLVVQQSSSSARVGNEQSEV